MCVSLSNETENGFVWISGFLGQDPQEGRSDTLAERSRVHFVQGLSGLRLHLCLLGSWWLLSSAAWPCWGLHGATVAKPFCPSLLLWGGVQRVELCLLSDVT